MLIVGDRAKYIAEIGHYHFDVPAHQGFCQSRDGPADKIVAVP